MDIPSIFHYILKTYTVRHFLYFESGFVGDADGSQPHAPCLLRQLRVCDLPLESLLNTPNQTTQVGIADATPSRRTLFGVLPPVLAITRIQLSILPVWVGVNDIKSCIRFDASVYETTHL
jgi:hypothetical protein